MSMTTMTDPYVNGRWMLTKLFFSMFSLMVNVDPDIWHTDPSWDIAWNIQFGTMSFGKYHNYIYIYTYHQSNQYKLISSIMKQYHAVMARNTSYKSVITPCMASYPHRHHNFQSFIANKLPELWFSVTLDPKKSLRYGSVVSKFLGTSSPAGWSLALSVFSFGNSWDLVDDVWWMMGCLTWEKIGGFPYG